MEVDAVKQAAGVYLAPLREMSVREEKNHAFGKAVQ